MVAPLGLVDPGPGDGYTELAAQPLDSTAARVGEASSNIDCWGCSSSAAAIAAGGGWRKLERASFSDRYRTQ